MKQKLSNEIISDLYHTSLKFLLNNASSYEEKSVKNLERQIWEGSIKLQDIILINQLVNNNYIDTYLEIGSYLGFSFFMFMKLFQSSFGTSIDPNIKHRIFNKPRDMFYKINNSFFENQQVKCLDGFFAGYDGLTLAHAGLPDIENTKVFKASDFSEKYDCIFIDGAHDYLSVQRDFIEASILLNDRGIIILHDIYSWPGVKNFCVDLDKHLDWTIIRTPLQHSIDGFAVVTRTNNLSFPQPVIT